MSAAVTATATSPDGRIDRDFVDLFSFLSQYHWIHDLQLTKFLESEVWNHLPSEWVTALTTMSVKELNHLPFQNSPEEFSLEVSPEISADTPPTNHHARDNSLASFLRKATNLSHHHQQQQSQRVILPPPIQIGSGLRKGMSPKKLHEVERMASLVHQVAAELGCNLVVDVGSGLGYLGQVLHKTYGLSVIGLESSQGHSDGAEKRAAKQGLHCSGMRSVPFLVSQDDDNIEQFRRLIRRIADSIEPCQHSSAVPSGPPLDRHGDVSAAAQRDSVMMNNRESERSPESTKPERHKDAVSTEKSVNRSPKTWSQQQDQGRDEERPGNRCGREKIEEDGFDGLCEGGQRGEEGVRVCLVGLHCCGDLTPAMVRLYRAVPCLRALCCVSCCYHKMQLQTGSEELFINFPMSVAANTAYAEVCARRASSSSSSASPVSSLSSPSSSSSSSSASSVSSGAFLTPCSLRLAAQETRVQWASQTAEDHENHTRHVAYRALLELFLWNTGHAAPDRRRMHKLNYTTFDNFVQSYITAAGIQEDEQAQMTERRLNTLYDQYKGHFKHIEPYTCLQVILQPVLERTVLRDRQRWLAEQGLTSDLLPIFDEVVSPRNLALVSVKSRPNA
ncbi:hypothetical protein ACOMHN_049548 [Nucella lapillus]